MRCNRKKLAAILGVDVKTIDSMVQKGLPYLRRPDAHDRSWEFDTAAVLRWMVGADTDDRLKQARARKAKAEASLRELQYGEQAGYLVHRDKIVERVVAGDAIVKSHLLALPARVAQLIAIETDVEVVEKILRKEMDAALDQLNKDWKDRG
jgi:phage terminase Nu1 subunit (DNA packaging protein)